VITWRELWKCGWERQAGRISFRRPEAKSWRKVATVRWVVSGDQQHERTGRDAGARRTGGRQGAAAVVNQPGWCRPVT
jgi:hypothetical protein